MENAIYMVRKHYEVKIESKSQALAIVAAAAKEGYKFGYKKLGWNHLVVDLEA